MCHTVERLVGGNYFVARAPASLELERRHQNRYDEDASHFNLVRYSNSGFGEKQTTCVAPKRLQLRDTDVGYRCTVLRWVGMKPTNSEWIIGGSATVHAGFSLAVEYLDDLRRRHLETAEKLSVTDRRYLLSLWRKPINKNTWALG